MACTQCPISKGEASEEQAEERGPIQKKQQLQGYKRWRTVQRAARCKRICTLYAQHAAGLHAQQMAAAWRRLCTSWWEDRWLQECRISSKQGVAGQARDDTMCNNDRQLGYRGMESGKQAQHCIARITKAEHTLGRGGPGTASNQMPHGRMELCMSEIK